MTKITKIFLICLLSVEKDVEKNLKNNVICIRILIYLEMILKAEKMHCTVFFLLVLKFSFLCSSNTKRCVSNF